MDFEEKRMYILNIIGKGVLGLIEDLDNIKEKFIKKEEIIEKHIQYGNSFYFISKEDIGVLSDELNKIKESDLGYVLLDITDNLNPFDFMGNITKNHENSKEFVEMIKEFTEKVEEVKVTERTQEELLAEAIENEDYEKAAKIRDEINKKESINS
jgi:hypothetical protein